MIDFEMINKIEEWGFEFERDYIDWKKEVKYKLYHEDAIKLTTFSDYLGNEFEKYLKDNEIELENWQPSDVEEFFEQYEIELF